MVLPKKIIKKLADRKETESLRTLDTSQNQAIDFVSNDYLGISASKTVFQQTHQYLIDNQLEVNGGTGSRLLSGNHKLYSKVEDMIASYHHTDSALVFNSGYDANVGFFSSVPSREDVILYDEYIHASIRDGIGMSKAKSFKFKHNDLRNLAEIIGKVREKEQTVYVVTESVFSMDGDSPDLESMANYCSLHGCYLIVDEAHAVGVVGEKGVGLVQELGIEKQIFARIITFGKALGSHGAAILGDVKLKEYLINFSRSFIYTTSLPPHSIATVLFAYQEMEAGFAQQALKNNIDFFIQEIKRLKLSTYFISSNSAIQSYVMRGNSSVKSLAEIIQSKGFNVKPILSPTVPSGQERLRFCIHSFNTSKEITEILELLATFVQEEKK